MDISKIIGFNLKRLRKRYSWTSEELAEQAEISPEYLRKLESGRGWPGKEMISTLAKALAVDESELFLDPAQVERTPEKIVWSLAEATLANKKRLRALAFVLGADEDALNMFLATIARVPKSMVQGLDDDTPAT